MARAKRMSAAEKLGAALKGATQISDVDKQTEATLVRLRSYPLAETQVEPFLRAVARVPALGQEAVPALRSILVAVYLQAAMDTRHAMTPEGAK